MDWNGAYSATFTSPDLVEEVQVNVTSLDAALGRGVGQVRLQTRSGTNDFHGALFYTNQNSELGANDWFNNLVQSDRPFVDRNQFGGRIGGPILRNKLFSFFLYDGQRYVEKQEHVATVLTEQARQGNFRFLSAGAAGQPGGASRRNGNAFASTPSVDLAGNILTADPRTGAPLFLNSFSVFDDVNDPFRTQIDPAWVGSQYLPRMPLPNDFTVGDGLNTAGFRWKRRLPGLDGATGNTQTRNRNNYNVRLDYEINRNNKVSFSMTQEENWGVTGQTGLTDFPAGYSGQVRREPDFFTASWTSTISPTILNKFRWGRKNDSWFGEPPTDIGCCSSGVFDQSNLTDLARQATAAFPQVGGQLFHITPGMGLGQFAWMGVPTPRGSESPLMQFADTLSWTRGAHSFQAGFESTFANTKQFNHGEVATSRPSATLGFGTVAVPGITTANFPGLNTFDIGTAQNLLANLSGTVATLNQMFLINSPEQTQFSGFQDGEILFRRNFHQNDYAGFFKDTWKVTPDLTLNLGVRYDFYGTPYESNGLGLRPAGGQSGLFGISGRDFGALFNPGAAGGSLTTIEFAGKDSPNSDTLLFNNDTNNFSPSFGFSWNVPWLRRTTVVRGGYGINYTGAPTFLQFSSIIGGTPGSTLNLTPPPPGFLNVGSATAASAGIFPLDTGGIRPLEAVPLTNRITALQGFADDRVVPYVQNWNLSLQRELAPNLTLELVYIGSKGSKLRSVKQLNTINVFENGIVDAFNTTRAGGQADLFDRMLDGIQIGSITVGRNGSGSEALRRFSTTNQWIANGEVASLANWLNSTPTGTGENGGLLRRNGFPENFIVVNPQFGSILLHGNDDNSIYHSLQTQLRKRLSHGFSGEFSYTWSRNIGNSAAGNAFASDTTASERDPRNRQLQRGLVDFHRTHNFKAHGTWALPFGPGRRLLTGGPAWIGRLAEGWDVSGIFSWNSGQPLSLTTTRRTLDSRSNINTPDLVGLLPDDLGNVRKRDGFVEFFEELSTEGAPAPGFGGNAPLAGRFSNNVIVDSAGNIVLQNPAPGAAGNLGLRLSGVEGPSRLGLDMALSKRIRINERTTFTIRADAVNILNRPIWNNPNTDINSADFGRITGAGGARTITINARIDF